jgi:hypothetical protein
MHTLIAGSGAASWSVAFLAAACRRVRDRLAKQQ